MVVSVVPYLDTKWCAMASRLFKNCWSKKWGFVHLQNRLDCDSIMIKIDSKIDSIVTKPESICGHGQNMHAGAKPLAATVVLRPSTRILFSSYKWWHSYIQTNHTGVYQVFSFSLHPGSPIGITPGDPNITAGLFIQGSKGDCCHHSLVKLCFTVQLLLIANTPQYMHEPSVNHNVEFGSTHPLST